MPTGGAAQATRLRLGLRLFFLAAGRRASLHVVLLLGRLVGLLLVLLRSGSAGSASGSRSRSPSWSWSGLARLGDGDKAERQHAGQLPFQWDKPGQPVRSCPPSTEDYTGNPLCAVHEKTIVINRISELPIEKNSAYVPSLNSELISLKRPVSTPTRGEGLPGHWR